MACLAHIRHKDQTLEDELQFNEEMIAEREEGIKDIESAIVEVNDIFRDLGTLVNDQQGMLGMSRLVECRKIDLDGGLTVRNRMMVCVCR